MTVMALVFRSRNSKLGAVDREGTAVKRLNDRSNLRVMLDRTVGGIAEIKVFVQLTVAPSSVMTHSLPNVLSGTRTTMPATRGG